jgi:site-specific DNA-methyltransferase (adenine-specific)
MKYEINNIYNEDCLQAMKQMPDNYFELAIVDPPYGTGMNVGRNNQNNDKDWDNVIPPKEYFDELFRVSKKYIIWGG